MSRIHLSKAHLTGLEERFVLDALRSGWVAPLGPHVDAFEVEVAERLGVRAALAVSSGTAALHLALREVGARPGTVVLVPSMTFVASANAVVYTGATPVFVDSRSSDGNVDPHLLIEAVDILQREGTVVAAAMTVDLFGRCAEYDEIIDALEQRDVPLVADAAEAMGSSYRGRAAGSFGRAAALSFNGNKIMTSAGGGMLLSDDELLIARCRYLSTQARQPTPHYEHTEVGYNYRLSNILAALGRGQLASLDAMIARRREIRRRYAAGIADLPGVRLLAQDWAEDHDGDNCWLTCVVLDPQECPVTAETVLKSLDDEDIEARYLWKPMHLQPLYANARAFLNGASEHLFHTGLALPSGSALTDPEIDRVIAVLRAAVGGVR